MYPIGTDRLEALACMAHNLKLPVKPWLFWARYRAWRQDHREWCLINDRDSYLSVILDNYRGRHPEFILRGRLTCEF